MDHLNKKVMFKNQVNNGLKKVNTKGISSQLKRVPTRKKNDDLDKFPEISLENATKKNYNDNLHIPMNDKKDEINDKRIGIGFFKKNK